MGKDVACRVSLFSSKAEINDALLVQTKVFRAEANKFNYIGLAVLFNTSRDNDELTDGMSSALSKIHTHYGNSIAVVISQPQREINLRPFSLLRETNPFYGTFDNKVNRTYADQVNALRGWLMAMFKNIKPTTGSIFTAPTNSSNQGGGKATSGGSTKLGKNALLPINP